jgi:hypothetical protein
MKEDELGKTYSTNGEVRSNYKILVRKPLGKRSRGDLGVDCMT